MRDLEYALQVVSYLDSTSNHNGRWVPMLVRIVVSYLDSTSNHNNCLASLEISLLFHILILHQTTTEKIRKIIALSCFISWFYIKPQRLHLSWINKRSCFISWFYIKPQLDDVIDLITSCCFISWFYIKPQLKIATLAQAAALFHILILHQTTTHFHFHITLLLLFHILILHQTTTITSYQNMWILLFHILILHQTTTRNQIHLHHWSLFHILILHQTTTCTI